MHQPSLKPAMAADAWHAARGLRAAGHDPPDAASRLRNGALEARAMVDTETGPIAAQNLRAGDILRCLCHGWARLLSAEVLHIRALGAAAPICLDPGALNCGDRLLLAPESTLLLHGWRAETLCGTQSALVRVRHLVNHATVHRIATGVPTTYVKLCFERPCILLVNGVGILGPGLPSAAALHLPLASKEKVRALFGTDL